MSTITRYEEVNCNVFKYTQGGLPSMCIITCSIFTTTKNSSINCLGNEGFMFTNMSMEVEHSNNTPREINEDALIQRYSYTKEQQQQPNHHQQNEGQQQKKQQSLQQHQFKDPMHTQQQFHDKEHPQQQFHDQQHNQQQLNDQQNHQQKLFEQQHQQQLHDQLNEPQQFHDQLNEPQQFHDQQHQLVHDHRQLHEKQNKSQVQNHQQIRTQQQTLSDQKINMDRQEQMNLQQQQQQLEEQLQMMKRKQNIEDTERTHQRNPIEKLEYKMTSVRAAFGGLRLMPRETFADIPFEESFTSADSTASPRSGGYLTDRATSPSAASVTSLQSVSSQVSVSGRRLARNSFHIITPSHTCLF